MGLSLTPSSRSAEVGKWLGLATAVWVQCISGNNYTFSNYSDALKSLMGLTQLELNNLSVAKDVGKAFGILAGLASDRLSTPVILLIGSLEGLVGYGAQWLVVRQSISPLPYWQMCIFLCMGGNSTTWMNTAVLVTCMRNFRRNRGPVSGILKGYALPSSLISAPLCSPTTRPPSSMNPHQLPTNPQLQKEESRGNEDHVAAIKGYRSKIESELNSICDGILKLLDLHLVPSAFASDSKVFYLKMKGDYHRYLAVGDRRMGFVACEMEADGG